MPEIGTILSHYRITEKLGAGGMGIVYRAHDTTLDRQVAIKVLPDIFAGDPERLARFEREAKLLASLNHPNIAAIHSLEQAEGKHFLVMELVEGETLAQRIAKGPLPIDEALDVCRQVAEGVESAHERGIIHRDLKPANIKITPEGKVKVLDFGLARAFQEESTALDASHSPTLTDQVTRPGVILGTAAYMSPEQAKGKTVNKRADIWAFGCILYESLTGKRAFAGETVTETLASILKEEPDWALLPSATPPLVALLLKRCLQRDPGHRLRDIGDARIDMTDPISQTLPGAPTSVTRINRVWKNMVLILALLLAGMAAAIGYFWLKSSPKPDPVWSTIELPPGFQLAGSTSYPSRTQIALSPDGKYLAFSAIPIEAKPGPNLYLRFMGRDEAVPIKGTEGASQPFFSPDGKWIGFWANEKLYKVSLAGGMRQELVACPANPKGVFWWDDGSVIWGGGGIRRIPAEGGIVLEITKVDPTREIDHTLPFVLPGGKAMLFTVMPDDFGNRAHIEAASYPAGGSRKTVIENAADARYIPSTGHLVFLRQGMLMAVAFDPERLATSGPEVLLLAGVEQALNTGNANYHSGAGQFSISKSGSLVYAPGGIDHFFKAEVVLVDRNGKSEVLAGFNKPEVTNQVRLSPDRRRLAFVQQSGPLWLFDMERATHTKLSPDGIAVAPRWSLDGKLAFGWSDAASWKIWQISIEAGDRLEPLIENPTGLWLSSWSRDGRFLAAVQYTPGPRADIVYWDMQQQKLIPFLSSASVLACPEFSPDGRWLAYAYGENKRREVYLRSFPDGNNKIKVTDQGGSAPAWSADGRELFYVSWAPAKMMKVDIKLGTNPTVGLPQPLFDFQFLQCYPIRGWDLYPDGRRFIFTRIKERAKPADITRIKFVTNWFEELKRLLPTENK